MDYYELMGVSRDASIEQVTTAYRELAKKYHPDKNPGDQECVKKFKEITEAFETLTDWNKRAIYNGKHPERPKPKAKPKPKTKQGGKWVWNGKEYVLNHEYFRTHDPNIGQNTIWTPPPPKRDLWGNPIQNTDNENYFKDSVKYSSGPGMGQPDLR